jgi:hypothetical protein
VPRDAVRKTLLAHVKDWNSDPRRAATKALQGVHEVKKRLTGAAPIGPEQRWAALAERLDQRLLRQADWPALAQLMQKVHDQGHDVAALTRAVTRTPLNDLPAQDLRYRLAAHVHINGDPPWPPVHTSTAKITTPPGSPGKLPLRPCQRRGRPLVDQTLPAAFATAVVTTKMIKTRRVVRPETQPLIVMLAATLGGADGAPATPVNLGRPAARGEQSTGIG